MIKNIKLWLVVIILILLAAACGEGGGIKETTEPGSSDTNLALTGTELAASAIQKGGCSACHVIPGIPGAVGTLGPDLSNLSQVIPERIDGGAYTGDAKTVEEYLHEAIVNPDAYIAPECPTGTCQSGLMPVGVGPALSSEEMQAIIDYLVELPELVASGAVEVSSEAILGEAPTLTDEEFAWSKQTFFERCAGCHGTLRKGATGPALTPDTTLLKGTAGLAAIIFNGTTGGMPDWGKQGALTQEQTEIMAKFLQNEPPAPPELSLPEMKESWNLITPLADRPPYPQTIRNIDNYFIVTLRDAGQ